MLPAGESVLSPPLRIESWQNLLTLAISVVGPILSDLCAMCLQACCRGPASASSILPQTLSDSLSDSQTDFAQLQELRKVICHERQTGARRGDCCLALGRRVSMSTYIRHYTTYIINSLVVCSKAALLVPPQHFLQSSSIIFHHLTLSSIILSSFHVFLLVLYPYSCNCDSQSANHHDKSIVHIQMQPCTGGAEISKLLHTFRTLSGKHFSKKTWQ